MLPFLKSKQKMQSGISMPVEYRKSDSKSEDMPDEGSMALEMAAKDLMKGIHSSDHKLIASALRSAFEILDSMPHEEGPHIEEEHE